MHFNQILVFEVRYLHVSSRQLATITHLISMVCVCCSLCWLLVLLQYEKINLYKSISTTTTYYLLELT